MNEPKISFTHCVIIYRCRENIFKIIEITHELHGRNKILIHSNFLFHVFPFVLNWLNLESLCIKMYVSDTFTGILYLFA